MKIYFYVLKKLISLFKEVLFVHKNLYCIIKKVFVYCKTYFNFSKTFVVSFIAKESTFIFEVRSLKKYFSCWKNIFLVLIKNLDLHYLFVLMFFCFPSNNFPSCRDNFPFFLGSTTSTMQQKKCFAEGQNTVTPLAVSLKLAILRFPV